MSDGTIMTKTLTNDVARRLENSANVVSIEQVRANPMNFESNAKKVDYGNGEMRYAIYMPNNENPEQMDIVQWALKSGVLGRVKGWVQQGIDEGRAFYLTEDDEYKLFTGGSAELAAAASTNIEDRLAAPIIMASAMGVIRNALYMLMRPYVSEVRDYYEFNDNEQMLLALRHFRESATEFLWSYEKETTAGIAGCLGEDGNLNPDNKGLWRDSVFFNTDTYKDLSRIYKRQDGAVAHQDEKNEPIEINGCMMYYESEEDLQFAQVQASDFDEMIATALEQLVTYDRVMDCGIEADFSRGEIIAAIVQKWYEQPPEDFSGSKSTGVSYNTDGSVKKDERNASDVQTQAMLNELMEIISLMDVVPPLEQISKKDANYQELSFDTANATNCSNCVYFDPANSMCNMIKEMVDKKGICDFQQLKPAELSLRMTKLSQQDTEDDSQQQDIVSESLDKWWPVAYRQLQLPSMTRLYRKWRNETIEGKRYPFMRTLIDAKDAHIGTSLGSKLLTKKRERDKEIKTVKDELMDIYKNALPFQDRDTVNAVIANFGRKMEEYRRIGRIKNPEVKEYITGDDGEDEQNNSDAIEAKQEEGVTKMQKKAARTIPIKEAKCGSGTTCEQAFMAKGEAGKQLMVALKGYDADPRAASTEQVNVKEDLDGTQFRVVVDKLHGAKVRQAFELFTEVIKFQNPLDAKVLFASLFIRDGAIILKGVAGTGKTTMVEVLTMLVANPIDYLESSNTDMHPDGMLNETNTLDVLKNRDFTVGTVGIAKHNPDKQPDDIYYTTRIAVDKYSESQYLDWQKGNQGARRNPFDPRFLLSARPEESEEMIFAPTPRPIVTHPIKFHNEGNRMNSRVADATLGLLAEKEMEYQGETFKSPQEGPGALTLLDYNPHKDWEPDGELDRALLDRFDLSIFIPALDLGNKVALLTTRKQGDPKVRVQNAFNRFVKGSSDGFDPMTYEELCECWLDARKVYVPRRTLFLAACYTNTFSMTFKKVKAFNDQEALLKDIKYLLPEKVLIDNPKILNPLATGAGNTQDSSLEIKQAIMPFLDSSMENFGMGDMEDENTEIQDYWETKGMFPDALLRAMFGEDATDVTNPDGTIGRLNENYRPLGFRNTDSLIKLAMSYTWLEAVLDDADTSKGLIVTPATLLTLLPYTVGHRLNIGVGPGIKGNYVNTETWVKNDVIPGYIGKVQPFWEKMYDNTARTLFGDKDGVLDKGLVYQAVESGAGAKPITRDRFYKRFKKNMEAENWLANKSNYYRALIADPMSGMVQSFMYDLAKTICQGNCEYQPDDDKYLMSGNWSKKNNVFTD
jgi:MoxR-like ATPase